MAATPQTTTLHFPGTESWGQVLLRDEDDRWRPFAPAKGEVVIPAGVSYGLQIAPKLPGDHFPPEPFDGSKVEMLSLVGAPVTDHELGNLAKFPNLRYLHLDGPTITDLGAESIAALENLESLSITRSGFTAYGLERLLGLKLLKKLSLSGDGIDNATAEVIGQMVDLDSLHLSGSRIDDGGLQLLRGLRQLKECTLPSGITALGFQTAANWPELERLRAINCIFDADAAPTLESLQKLKVFWAPFAFGNDGMKALAQLAELRELGLFSTQVSTEGLRQLANLRNLEVLCLRSPVLWEECEMLASLPALRSLSLLHASTRLENLKPLAAASCLQSLTFSMAVNETLEYQAMEPLTRLEELQLFSSALTPWEFADIREWLSATKVTHRPRVLYLSAGRLQGEVHSRTFSKDTVNPWQPHPSQRSRFSGFPQRDVYTFPVECEISYRCRNTEPREIEDLLQKHGLEILELVFKECYISRDVAGFLPYFGRVKTLDLSHCEIDMRFFHTVHLMASLSRLVLDFSNLGDAQAELLSKANRVETLLARGTMLGDMGLAHLESMKGLKTLDIAGTRATPQAIEQFRNARPDVEMTA